MAYLTKLNDTHFLIGAVIILVLLFIFGKCSLRCRAPCGGFGVEGFKGSSSNCNAGNSCIGDVDCAGGAGGCYCKSLGGGKGVCADCTGQSCSNGNCPSDCQCIGEKCYGSNVCNSCGGPNNIQCIGAQKCVTGPPCSDNWGTCVKN